jgi:ATP-dependent Clp protease adaptor protein ClpS
MSTGTLIEPDVEKDVRQDEALEPLYKVFIHNDDVTPFEFVIVVLQRFFELDGPTAELVTFAAHTSGIAYVTTLPLGEAKRRVSKARFAASLEGYPLAFSLEPE